MSDQPRLTRDDVYQYINPEFIERVHNLKTPAKESDARGDRIAVLEVALAGLISAITSECPKPLFWSGESSQLHALHAAIRLGRQALAGTTRNPPSA